MLLKDNFIRLTKLGLGQADFVLTRKIFSVSETLAKKKQQLNFLRRCSDLNIFPPTIDNIHLPSIFDTNSLMKAKQQVKRFLLNKSKKQLRREIALKYREQSKLHKQLSTHATELIVRIVNRNRYLAYNTASKTHGERLKKKLEKLMSTSSLPVTTTVSLNDSDKSQLVTDLTRTLTPDELNLLSKGPKFSLLDNINDGTFTALSIGFYRLANQIRWQQVEITSNEIYLHTHNLSPSVNLSATFILKIL